MASVGNGSGPKAQPQPRVVICGAGVIGSSVAYYLSQKGIAATVVERTGIACAASGKAGGFLAFDWSDGSPGGPLSRHSFKLHEELAGKFGDKIGYRRVNTMSVKTTAMHGKGKQSKVPKSVVPSWIDGEVLSSRLMADTTTTAQVHPEKLTNALFDEARASGAALHIGTVQGLVTDTEGTVTGVKVDGSVVDADVVVIAMGPWTKLASLWSEGVPAIEAQKAHSIVLEPAAPISADMLFLDHRTKQGRPCDPEVYPRPDGSVYICGEVESVEPPNDPAAIQPKAAAISNLQEVASAISSSLAEGKLLKEQACFLPLSPDGVPVIGAVPGTAKSLYVASGHSCWGILNAPATGEAIADMIAGEQPKLDMSDFDPARLAARRLRSRTRASS